MAEVAELPAPTATATPAAAAAPASASPLHAASRFLSQTLFLVPRHIRLLLSHSYVTRAVRKYHYQGEGTKQSPYQVEFIPNDPRDPHAFSSFYKWLITMLLALATFGVMLTSSTYAGAGIQILIYFRVSPEVVTLGLSLFVVGFAVGPLLWAPLSEMYGRQIMFFITFGAFSAFNAGVAISQNIQSLIILRFFAGAFGSTIQNSAGAIADMFEAKQRGLAISLFAAAPFLGLTIGPIIGGYLSESKGWRWVEGLAAILTGTLWIACFLIVPETHAPVLLRRRAKKLTQLSKKNKNKKNKKKREKLMKDREYYRSKLDVQHGRESLLTAFRISITRPILLLLFEPIVLLLAIYEAIIYGTIFMFFAAFPIVFQVHRGWSQGDSGAAFTGAAVGVLIGSALLVVDYFRYIRTEKRYQRKGKPGAPPESRLLPCMLGAILIPAGLFLFAWTNYPDIFWLVCIIGSVLFGCGTILVFLGVTNYLIDSYVIYAASALAATTLMASGCGAAFPLFTTYMYNGLGIHWASSVPGFLALGCVPFPFLFYVFGPWIRSKGRYAKEAQDLLFLLKR